MITVVLTTFGRSQELLEEALNGFLLQEHPAKLLIVNIHPTPVVFNHPDVEIHNIEPFEFYGQQVCYALSQIDTPLWCIWDSDDIVLPWHLKALYSNYHSALHPDNRIVYPTIHPCQVGYRNVWYSYKNELKGRVNPNWTCYLYDALDKDQLATLEVKSKCWYIDQVFYKQDFFKAHLDVLNPKTSYIVREGLGWQVTKNLDKNMTCSDIVKEMPGYSGALKPHWREDYLRQTESFLSPRGGDGPSSIF